MHKLSRPKDNYYV